MKDINALNQELKWLDRFIDLRIKHYFQTEDHLPPLESLAPPEIEHTAQYRMLIDKYKLTRTDRLLLALSIAPLLKPALLDVFFLKNKNFDRGFSEFGGVKGTQHGGFLPTIETALFILSGDDLSLRLSSLSLFSNDSVLFKNNLLTTGEPQKGEPSSSITLSPHPSFIGLILEGQYTGPNLSTDFPAKRIETSMEWDELILDEEVLTKINEINIWLTHQQVLLEDWGLSKKLKRGFRCLFYGPPGTGKTLTATLLGKVSQMPVYRVDLSLIVSKYIGETEKNLNRVFNMAEHQRWILFFDEADALFGSRVETTSSNDRHSNQEIAFLLQRIEDFDGLIILASNIKGNIDEAFARRFQSMIYFPFPDKEERLKLWSNYFKGQLPVDPKVDFTSLADQYELSGGNIVNILRYSAIKAVVRTPQLVLEEDLIEGIRREYKHLGKSI